MCGFENFDNAASKCCICIILAFPCSYYTAACVGEGITSFRHLLLTDPVATEVEVLVEVFFYKNGEREAGKEAFNGRKCDGNRVASRKRQQQ